MRVKYIAIALLDGIGDVPKAELGTSQKGTP